MFILALGGSLVIASPQLHSGSNSGTKGGGLDSGPSRTTQPGTLDADTTETTVTSGPCSLRVSIEKPIINTAQQLTVTIEVTSPARYGVEFPEIAGKFGPFAVISITNAPSSAPSSAVPGGESNLRSTRTVRLEPFLAGDYEVPAIEVVCREGDTGNRQVLRSVPLRVRVNSLLSEGDQKADPAILDSGTIRPVFEEPSARGNIMWLLAGIAAALLVAGFAGWRFTRHLRREQVHTTDDLIDRLTRLRNSGAAGHESLAICHEIAAALRRAWSERTGSDASAMVSHELAGAVAADGQIGVDRAASVRSILDTCDTSRFSGEPLSSYELNPVLDQALEILRLFRDAPREIASTAVPSFVSGQPRRFGSEVPA